MELEVWPNFIKQCDNRGIPVLLANGRITEPSFRRYKWAGGIGRRMFARLARVCVQDELYAQRFRELGAQPDRVRVVGTMKFDAAQIVDRVHGDAQLAWEVGLTPQKEFIWVCGSTGPGEEEILLTEYRALLGKYGRLRLAIVPRHPQRFDEVAELIEDHRFKVVRRSQPGTPGPVTDPVPPVVLGDTMGELKKFYSLADIVFVGRTLVDLGPRQHGSDMIEPAALAKPVLVGPYTGNFAEAVTHFRSAEAIIEVPDEESLGQTVKVLLSTPAEAKAMAARAQDVVRRER